ncbi:MAG: helix-turn-helix domain-containing protein [Lachnospiraceae bacterium]|nr:helix-turn-helix domain-containing protein [Lachnospiraceae bacterium]
MDELYTVKEVAKIMKVNVHRVYDLIHAGLLPALKLGSIKIRAESLNEFLKKYDGMDLTDLDKIHRMDVMVCDSEHES